MEGTPRVTRRRPGWGGRFTRDWSTGSPRRAAQGAPAQLVGALLCTWRRGWQQRSDAEAGREHRS